MKRFNPSVRTPLDKLNKVIALLQQSPREPDSQIAHLTGVSRRQVNTIRRIFDESPALVPQLQRAHYQFMKPFAFASNDRRANG